MDADRDDVSGHRSVSSTCPGRRRRRGRSVRPIEQSPPLWRNALERHGITSKRTRSHRPLTIADVRGTRLVVCSCPDTGQQGRATTGPLERAHLMSTRVGPIRRARSIISISEGPIARWFSAPPTSNAIVTPADRCPTRSRPPSATGRTHGTGHVSGGSRRGRRGERLVLAGGDSVHLGAPAR